jgi:hypothetical protein
MSYTSICQDRPRSKIRSQTSVTQRRFVLFCFVLFCFSLSVQPRRDCPREVDGQASGGHSCRCAQDAIFSFFSQKLLKMQKGETRETIICQDRLGINTSRKLEPSKRGVLFVGVCVCVCVCVCVADDAWTTWPGYPGCLGLGDTFATSLYTVPEYEATRETYRRTVAYAYVVIVNTSAY